MKIPINEQKAQKKFFVFTIIVFEYGAANSHNPEHDTFHPQSIFQQTSLRFQISIKETFPKLFQLRVTKKYDKTSLMPIFQVFATF